eukprot:scaffold4838_cov110-Cylindrotheca_fusiformis.AAC.4
MGEGSIFLNGQKPKKRSRRSEVLRGKKKGVSSVENGFDLPPTEADEFDLADMVGSIKKQKVQSLSASSADPSELRIQVGGNVATIPKTDEDEKRVARILQVEKHLNDKVKEKKVESQARVEGESKRAYARRTKAETRQIMKQSTAVKNPEKKKKKKEFMNKKKNKKRGSAMHAFDPREMDDNTKEDIALDRPPQPEIVHFNEQAERPPTFKQLPRGAIEKGKTSTYQSKSSGMTDAQVEAEKNAMEAMRRKVQAQYASIKARRRRAGDFHL